MKGQYVTHPTIGKGKLTKGKKSAKGVVYDQIEAFILDPKTGDHIGLKMFVSSSPIINNFTKKAVVDENGNEVYSVSIKYKGLRKAADFATGNLQKMRFVPTATKYTIEAKDTGATQGNTVNVSATTSTDEDENVF